MSGFEPDLRTATKQMIAKSASNTNPGVKISGRLPDRAEDEWGKNPPTPPTAPASPVTAPTDCGKIQARFI
jgi:hypothetical protein